MSNQSPYEAPKATLDPIQDTIEVHHFELANNWHRLCNYLIDMVIYYILVFIVAFIIAFIALSMGAQLDGSEQLFSYSIAFTVMLLYYTLFEATLGKTPAKFFTGTRVVDEHGGQITFGRAFLRSLCRIVPFEPFSFLFGRSGGWHDHWTNTQVIKTR